LTGHFVFGTLHTQDAPQTVDRIIDVFPPHQQHQIRAQLANALQGIITQTLVPKRDGNGRVVACEVLVPTPGDRNLIQEGKNHQTYSAMQTGGKFGMQTVDAALVELLRRGVISREEPEKRSSNPEELKRLAGGSSVGSGGYAVLKKWRRGRVATFTCEAATRQGDILQDEIEGSGTGTVASELRQQGAPGYRHKRAGRRAERHPRALQEGQAGRPRRIQQAVRHHD
jgi:hypothetical protein